MCKLGQHVPDHYGKSMRTLQHNVTELVDNAHDVEQEYWWSTLGLLVALLHFRQKRKERADQARAVTVAVAFVREVLPSLPSAGVGDISEGVRRLCVVGPVLHGVCACAQAWVDAHPHPWPQQHVDFVAYLVRMEDAVGDCKALGVWMGVIRTQICEQIDDAGDGWGHADWYKTRAAFVPGNKRSRRVDPHVKRWAIAQSLSDGRHRSACEAERALEGGSKTLHDSWRDEELSASRAALHMSFAGVQNLSLTWDGVRLGNPGKEYLLSVASAPNKPSTHGVLPCQDPS